MISVEEALSCIRAHHAPLATEEIRLADAMQRVLAEDLSSPIDMPPFAQSAMDGYAVQLHDEAVYTVLGEIKAGDASTYTLKAGEAVRIFTGAMVPKGANCVVRQEDVERDGTLMKVHNVPSAGEHIRPQGEQIRQGQLALRRGAALNPGTIGYLATLGYTQVRVYRQARIALIATGNELQKPGEALEAGKIYESNTVMLRAALRQLGHDCDIYFVEDDYTATRERIAHCLEDVDLLLLSGGISVGDYDFVERALSELGVECHFYKVRQKPGKPLYFGSRQGTSVFALPGNPAAALTCFYVYVREALDVLQYKIQVESMISRMPLAEPYAKKAGLTHLLKARVQGGFVHILPAQSSAMLSAFSDANCLVIAAEERSNWEAGELIELIPLPQ